MYQWQRNVYVLWIAVLVAATSWSMVMPFMPVFLEQELGVTVGVTAWAGLLSAVNSLGAALVAPVWGAVGDRFGRKLMMLRATTALAVCYLLMSLVSGPYGLLSVRILIGLITGFTPTAMALVGTTTPQEHVGKALAVISTAMPTGNIIGPLFGGLLADLIGIRGTMAASAAVVGVSILLVIFFVREQFTAVATQKPNLLADMGEVMRDRTFAVLMVTTALAMAAMTMLDPVMVPFIRALLGADAPGWLAGGLYALPGLAFALAAPAWAAQARRWGFGANVALGLGLGAVLVASQAASATGWEFAGLRLSQGLVTAAIAPGIAALIAQVMPAAWRGRAFGINQSATSLGFAIGPLVGGLLDTWLGIRWVFVANGLLMAGAAAWTRLAVMPRLKSQGTLT